MLGEYESHVSELEVVEQIHKKLEHGGNCLAVLLCLISRIKDYYAVSNISLEQHFFYGESGWLILYRIGWLSIGWFTVLFSY